MKEYHKIHSVFKRDQNTHKFIEGEFSCPEFQYLKDNLWVWTEKIDGTNIRVHWDGERVIFGGRTDNSQIPAMLVQRLRELFPLEIFSCLDLIAPITLYGEGYGAKIQKGGGNYKHDGCDFILFDVLVGEWWLERENLEGVADKLGIDVVPIKGTHTLTDAIAFIKDKLVISTFGNFLAEGIVGTPTTPLFTRSGERVIVKIKHKDWK